MPKKCVICEDPHIRKSDFCCFECSVFRMLAVAKQMHDEKGPYYEKWKRHWEAATGLKLSKKGGLHASKINKK